MERSWPRDLLELALAFERSETLFTLVALRLPARIGDREVPIRQLARELGLHPLALRRFAGACAALGLLRLRGDRVRNGDLARRFLIPGTPDDLTGTIDLFDRVALPRWRKLRTHLRVWRPAPNGQLRAGSAGFAALRANHNLAHLEGRVLAERYEFGAHHRLLDLGGGSGATAIAICERHRRLEALVLDRPAVAPFARRMIRCSAARSRIRVAGADLCRDPLPRGYDVALLLNVLSMMGEQAERALLARVHRALEPGGVLLVGGWMPDPSRPRALESLFCLNDISWRAPDVEWPVATYARWLRTVGFRVSRRPMPAPASLLVARKPAASSRRARTRERK